MNCIIPGANIKVFGRAVHSLSKIGEELYIEALEHGLALRTVNSSRSAYACFVFAPSFFLFYSDGVNDGNSESSEEDVLKYKINMKSCIAVFRSLSTLDKTVDKCKIKLNQKEARLVFQMYCRHGIMKTHNLTFIECETLQAVFSKDLSPNVLIAQTKLLCEAVLNFQTTQEEVTLLVDPTKTRFKNYIDEDTEPQKVIHTEVSLEPDEFESYQVGIDVQLTFCLKELRAILAFAEPVNLPVSISFETAGKPIILSLDTDPSFEANFVLATLTDRGSSSVSSSQQSTQQPSQHITTKKSFSEASTSRKVNDRHGENGRVPSGMGRHNSIHTPASAATAQRDTSRHTPPPRRPASVKAKPDNSNSRTRTRDDTDRNLTKPEAAQPSMMATSSEKSQLERRREDPQEHNDDDDDSDLPCSPIIPIQTSRLTEPVSMSRLVGDDSTTEDEQDDEECVPGTPPSKKFKSMFFGLSQSTSQSYQKAILAKDTDDDTDGDD